MQLPVTIAFDGVPESDAVQQAVWRHAAELERFFDHITSCRVAVARPKRHKRKGGLFSVRIDLTVPGEDTPWSATSTGLIMRTRMCTWRCATRSAPRGDGWRTTSGASAGSSRAAQGIRRAALRGCSRWKSTGSLPRARNAKSTSTGTRSSQRTLRGYRLAMEFGFRRSRGRGACKHHRSI